MRGGYRKKGEQRATQTLLKFETSSPFTEIVEKQKSLSHIANSNTHTHKHTTNTRTHTTHAHNTRTHNTRTQHTHRYSHTRTHTHTHTHNTITHTHTGTHTMPLWSARLHSSRLSFCTQVKQRMPELITGRVSGAASGLLTSNKRTNFSMPAHMFVCVYVRVRV